MTPHTQETQIHHSAFRTKELAFISIAAALLVVCSWISIPLVVPVTLQTFAIFLILELLGGRDGFYAILIFLLLGAVGLPVFAGFTGGVGILFGTTGGYLIGFLLTAAAYWLLERFPLHEKIWFRVIALWTAYTLCYMFGTAWFMQVYAHNVEAITFSQALSWCVVPFLLPDIIKLLLAEFLAGRIRHAIKFS